MRTPPGIETENLIIFSGLRRLSAIYDHEYMTWSISAMIKI
jgi:hypothetical protein